MVPLLLLLTKKDLFREKCGKIRTCRAGQLAKPDNETQRGCMQTPFSPIRSFTHTLTLFPSLLHPSPLFPKTLELLALWLALTGLRSPRPQPHKKPQVAEWQGRQPWLQEIFLWSLPRSAHSHSRAPQQAARSPSPGPKSFWGTRWQQRRQKPALCAFLTPIVVSQGHSRSRILCMLGSL